MLLGIPEARSSGDSRSPGRQPAPRGGCGAGSDYDALGQAEVFSDYITWRAEHPSDDLMTQLLSAEFEDENGTPVR